jgi:hypothetical protein
VGSRDRSTDRVRCLLNKYDAHAWYQVEKGMTALHYACNSGPDDAEKIKLLLDEGGAKIDALNKAGESPLRLAIKRKGAFSATARCFRDRGGIDQGPRPRQTSPLRQPYQSPIPPWTEESPPRRYMGPREEEAEEGDVWNEKRALVELRRRDEPRVQKFSWEF